MHQAHPSKGVGADMSTTVGNWLLTPPPSPQVHDIKAAQLQQQVQQLQQQLVNMRQTNAGLQANNSHLASENERLSHENSCFVQKEQQQFSHGLSESMRLAQNVSVHSMASVDAGPLSQGALHMQQLDFGMDTGTPFSISTAGTRSTAIPSNNSNTPATDLQSPPNHQPPQFRSLPPVPAFGAAQPQPVPESKCENDDNAESDDSHSQYNPEPEMPENEERKYRQQTMI